MDKKLIFLDIDGTLTSCFGSVPASAREAIKKARANGHYVCISSGRSICEIDEDVKSCGFDGYVSGAGAYVEFQGKEVFSDQMDALQIENLSRYLDDCESFYFFERTEGCYGKIGFTKKMRALEEKEHLAEKFKGNTPIPPIIEVEDITSIVDVNKVMYYKSKKTASQMASECSNQYTFLPISIVGMDNLGGEISKITVNKAVGISKMLEYLHMDRKDSIAIGDGYNDMEMIQFVHTGVAMGNACEALKEQADFVTADVTEDGVYKAFEILGLI